MPAVSIKGATTPLSPIRQLELKAQATLARGIKIYHLNIGQPDLITPPAILDALRRHTFTTLEYSPSSGLASYRSKLAAYYQSIDMPVNAADITVTTGGSEAIMLALQACFNAGEELIIPEPFYANISGMAHTAHIKIVPVTSRFEDGFALPPIQDFEACITPKTKAILICNPNNPTGHIYSAEEIQSLVRLVLQYNIFLFVDEVYRDFCYESENVYSPFQLAGAYNHILLFDSISKRYSACGARIGVVICKNQEVNDTILRIAQIRISPPYLGQILGEAALSLETSYMQSVVAEYKSRRDYLCKELADIEGVTCNTPKGAFYVMAKLPVADTTHFCFWLLEEFSWERQTLMLAPAAGFYQSPGFGLDEVRIAYVLQKNELQLALRCLKEGLKQYQAVYQNSYSVTSTI